MTEAEMEQFWANKKASNGHNFVANLEAAKRDGKTLRPWYEQDEAFAQKIIDGQVIIELGAEAKEEDNATRH